jgi:1-deoxy-D-xylulose 5-phosphate reductoisomerase
LRTLAVLGATGSIGRQALDLIRRHSGHFKASVLTANRNHEALYDMVRAFRPAAAGLVVQPESLPGDVRFCDWYFGEDCSERALRAHSRTTAWRRWWASRVSARS